MATYEKAASRFGWSGTGQIRMLGPDGEPLSAREVESVNAVLAYKAWVAADDDDPSASIPAGRL